MTDYPFWHKKYSEIAHDRFVGFYMSDEDYDKMIEKWPDGCIELNHIDQYSIFYNGKSVNEWFNMLPGGSIERIETLEKMTTLKNQYQLKSWDWHDLLYKGYHPFLDLKTQTMCIGKGKIKPNKHTKIELLDTIPGPVQKAWKSVQPYIQALKDIAMDIERSQNDNQNLSKTE